MLIGPRALSLLLAVSRCRVEWTALMTQSGPSDANASWTCTDVLAHIYEFIDGALPAEADERMREHISACGYCRPSFERERDLIDLLARRCKTEPCPGELRQRIIDSLSQARRRHSGET